jgi:hypothetical protein
MVGSLPRPDETTLVEEPRLTRAPRAHEYSQRQHVDRHDQSDIGRGRFHPANPTLPETRYGCPKSEGCYRSV